MRIKDINPEIDRPYTSGTSRGAVFVAEQAGYVSIEQQEDRVLVAWSEDAKTLPDTLRLFASTPAEIIISRYQQETMTNDVSSIEKALSVPDGIEDITIKRALGGMVVWEYQPDLDHSTLKAFASDWDSLRYMTVELDASHITKELPAVVRMLSWRDIPTRTLF